MIRPSFPTDVPLIHVLIRERANDERLRESVLDWNAPAIGFCRARGAEMLDDRTGCRASRAALDRLAARDDPA